TAVHLVLSSVEALIRPRVKKQVEKLDQLIEGLDHKARELLASEVNIDTAGSDDTEEIVVPLSRDKKHRVDRISALVRQLRDLRWRYTEGPGGRGRASLGMTN